MNDRIFNMHTDVNACDYTLVYRHHKKVCTEILLGEKSFTTFGNLTCVSDVLFRHSTN